ncbi:hypothetical protein [Neorhodopirellula lusitana]|uniref:hypothetical protein n=1 Tax=Neorhodopirellula lusitana TaxID=445327 RepID=UPI0024B6B97D|nr:hypothetical protein [Neorhodopirellula lusitana]
MSSRIWGLEFAGYLAWWVAVLGSLPNLRKFAKYALHYSRYIITLVALRRVG